ncbi:MAG: alpha/beta fold hydrolase [Acidobacteriota bacterium]
MRERLAVAAILAIGAAACSKHPAMNDEARARDFVGHLAKRDFAGAVAAFDDRMKAGLPADKLAGVWTQVEGQFGAFERVDKLEVTDHRVVAHATFAKASLVLRISLDPDGKIGGFYISPADTAKGWTSPPYAKPGAFEERDIKVGELPGTLTVPKGATHYPVLVLVHGSGPNDRDETIGAVKPFADLAQGLASRGIAVVRYDKRTRVDPAGVRTQTDEVDDAAHAAVALARALPDVDPERVALLGHSQGGYLAPRIAKADPAIKRLVILAGSTRPLEDSLLAQLRYFATLSPGDRKMKDAIAEAEQFKQTVDDPKLAPDTMVKLPFDGTVPGAYFLEVRDYHPAEVAAQLTIPLLVLQGERDYQVTVADDFAAWQKALAGHANATLRTYPGLNHAFTHGEGPPSPADYQHPGHVDEHVIDDIAAYLDAP